MTKAVAIIPARGGSKRIPFKNGRDFCGRPMMAWPIAAALESGAFDRVVVSTDDAALARIARDAGAEVPFLRAAELADDHAATKPVIADAVARLGLGMDVPVACIYATAAFVTAADLTSAITRIAETRANWVFTVGAYPAPIDRAYRMTQAGLEPRWPENMPKRSQDLEPAYFDAGQFYVARAEVWLAPEVQIWDGAEGIVLPRERCVDIDTDEDWRMAEALFRMQSMT